MFKIFLAALTVLVGSAQIANAAPPARNTHHAVARHHTGHHVAQLPRSRTKHVVRGGTFFFTSGVFYTAHSSGYVSIAAPIGAVISVLPVDHTVSVIRGTRYYQFAGNYYARHNRGFIVVNKPRVRRHR
jgi:hypothetical protein